MTQAKTPTKDRQMKRFIIHESKKSKLIICSHQIYLGPKISVFFFGENIRKFGARIVGEKELRVSEKQKTKS